MVNGTRGHRTADSVTQGYLLTIRYDNWVIVDLNAEGSYEGILGRIMDLLKWASRIGPLGTESGIPSLFLRYSPLFPQVVDRGLLRTAQTRPNGRCLNQPFG